MSDRKVTHGEFELERVFVAPPETVFAAFASAAAKDVWFVASPSWTVVEHTLDFRVGGRELLTLADSNARIHRLDALYYDIVRGERIVSCYEMYLDDVRTSVSVATIEFLPEDDGGTHVIVSDAGAYLDGRDKPDLRAEGMNNLLDSLERALP